MLFSLFPNLFLILILCVVTITDMRDQRIPDSAIVAAILVKIGHTVIFLDPDRLLSLLMDGLAVSLPVLLFTLVIEKLWKKEAMGGGDIKLIFVTGLYLGWEKNLWMLFMACMMGVVVGMKNKDYFSFGPIIAIATIFCMWI